MSPLSIALLLVQAAAAGTARVEMVPVRTEGAPTVTALPAGALAAPLSPALAAPLAPALGLSAAPALAAPVPVLPAPALVAVPAAPAAKPADPRPAAPSAVEALRGTGRALDAAKSEGASAAPALDALFDQGTNRPAAAPAAAAAASASGTLERATPRERTRRKMPEGVKHAFQNSAVLGGGMAALFGGLYAAVQSVAPQATLAHFALLALPIALIPLHFALVSSFWAGRYFAYPRLGPAGQAAFRAAWRAISVAYPLAAVSALGWWTQLMASQPLVLWTMALPLLVAAAEVFHHFIYRVQAERAQDKKKSLLDWRDRLGGNIGAQLRRMRAKGA